MWFVRNPWEHKGYNHEWHHMKHSLLKFWNDESGATAIEYGLIAAGIAIAIITVVNGLGSQLSTNFATISTSLK
jgi:pilus assembly protein Flp/PilA